jgi:hypothetical protein
MRPAVWLLLAAGFARGQELKIYSEFQRIGPTGEVVASDATGTPREILSPVVARNAWASFHVACTPADNEPSFLYIQQNPELFEVTVYKEHFVRTSRGWIPDGLEQVSLPHPIVLPDQKRPVPNQNTVVFWVDVRVPARTPVGRMRFQALLKSGDRWLVYPMEIRVAEKTVVGTRSARGPAGTVVARADSPLVGAVRKRLCGSTGVSGGAGSLTVRHLILRNALQDLSLVPGDIGPLVDKSFCEGRPADAEWWVPLRRAVYLGKLPARAIESTGPGH